MCLPEPSISQFWEVYISHESENVHNLERSGHGGQSAQVGCTRFIYFVEQMELFCGLEKGSLSSPSSPMFGILFCLLCFESTSSSAASPSSRSVESPREGKVGTYFWKTKAARCVQSCHRLSLRKHFFCNCNQYETIFERDIDFFFHNIVKFKTSIPFLSLSLSRPHTHTHTHTHPPTHPPTPTHTYIHIHTHTHTYTHTHTHIHTHTHTHTPHRLIDRHAHTRTL